MNVRKIRSLLRRAKVISWIFTSSEDSRIAHALRCYDAIDIIEADLDRIENNTYSWKHPIYLYRVKRNKDLEVFAIILGNEIKVKEGKKWKKC